MMWHRCTTVVDTPHLDDSEVTDAPGSQLRDQLSGFANEGIYLAGGQVYVEMDGAVVADFGFGHGFDDVEVSVADLHNLYCASKPFLGVLCGVLADAGALGLDEPVAPLLPAGLAHLASDEATPLAMLNHSVGLSLPTAAAWRMVPIADRRGLLERSRRQYPPGYSEIAAGLLLETAIECATGRPASELMLSEVLEPLGIAQDVVLDPERGQSDEIGRRVRVPVAGLPTESIPMLSELLPSQRSEVGPAFGALASMRGLGRFYSAVGHQLAGGSVPGLPDPNTFQILLGSERFAEPDQFLQRDCAFAGGFMTRLDETDFCPGVSGRAVGHISGNACCLAFHDPLTTLTAAVFTNGSLTSLEDIDFLRRRLMGQVFMAVGLYE